MQCKKLLGRRGTNQQVIFVTGHPLSTTNDKNQWWIQLQVVTASLKLECPRKAVRLRRKGDSIKACKN